MKESFTPAARQYQRKSHMYIDVLNLPNVSEAVHEASRMLRLGIMRAMSCSIEDEPDSSEKEERGKQATSQQLANTTQTRDAASVYSAIAKLPRKPLNESADSSANDSEAAEARMKQMKAWNSAKKAGPSILSRRSRPNSAGSVFQPAPKREKRNENVENSNNAKDKLQTSAKDIPKAQATSSTPSTDMAVTKLASTAKSTLRSSPNEKTPVDPRKELVLGIGSKEKQVGSNSPLKISSDVALASKPLPTVQSPRKTLPASWSTVGPKPFNQPRAKISSIEQLRKSTMKLGKPDASKRATTFLTPPTIRKSIPTSSSTSNAKPESVIPLPSSMGIELQYVPGSEIINGVRPNGYSVSNGGIVKPMVPFNPRPRIPQVPHKMRQNSVEKLFEAWRDSMKLPEADSLANALRIEQEMYAKASSKAEYRSSVTMKLSEVRKSKPAS